MFWNIIFGNPISKTELEKYTLPKKFALPILSSDALSSVAYATGEILATLAVAGVVAMGMSFHISLFIIALIVIVGICYIQTINAYPNGGGAYVVAKENLGIPAGLVAASALLIDYVLTVAVSISAGILAITSAFPGLIEYRTSMAVFAIVLMVWVNLRGIKDTATALVWPTYAFVVIIIIMVGIGTFNLFTGSLHPIDYSNAAKHLVVVNQTLSVTLILRAFSSGCSAMTGIEAIANGVSLFRPDRKKNAIITLIILMILLIVMFAGISYLSYKLKIHPLVDQSELSQLGHSVFGDGLAYYFLQLATCLILIIAANTSFSAFPILASILSRDGFLPAQFKNKDERLAFRNGIIILGLFAISLVILFSADTSSLIPLYSIGVFLAFTLCQSGLLIFWYKNRKEVKKWYLKSLINLVGCVTTFVTVLIITESKFTEGAWIVLIAIPILVTFFCGISRHYKAVSKSLEISSLELLEIEKQAVNDIKIIIPISSLHKGTLKAIEFAMSISTNIDIVTINIDHIETEKLKADWDRFKIKHELIVIEPKIQSFVYYFIKYVKVSDKNNSNEQLSTIVLPKVQNRKFWHGMLHNQRAFLLKWGLKSISQQGDTRVVIEVPYQI
ncbi:amino acid permease [Allofrancisella guangzhouensis]|uniref:Amino acid transporter n=1 Tax=Allofrancisella guangzhouensis TaxID=594679 RepID=A0A0A8E2X7_9GAMM|nr:amino acid permease [Allofrancisella guangzhouensis]AJC48363.1 amino acid transporter [Allofrancisella guangzhouensis]MBK2026543.1 amino acid permease [Allofrancisella guangzhouensis]MBK2044287.1 amino acid permease [Allofrancisella guangzhouensis]MBK2045530.1 amino acid permease [Allofrancisella guangzhouensis]